MPQGDDTLFRIGDVINEKWVVLEFLGKGGMGEVYKAHQIDLDRTVAIKVVSRTWIRSFDGDTDAINSATERFRREVRIMAQIKHPNVLQIHDYGACATGADLEPIEFTVMEYVPGGSLRSSMSDEGFYPDENRTGDWLVRFFLPLLEGARVLHDAGIIHRDLKPENVLLDNNIPKIADFGLARSLHFKPITQSIEMQGTPFYMSPEHFLDLKRTDERTDVYALGKILYEAISGKAVSEQIPFKKATLSQADTPFFQKLDSVIQNATEEKREDRFPTVQAFMHALKEIILEDDCAALPIRSETRARRMSHWKPLLITAALVLTASAAAGLGTLVYERGHHFKTEVNAPTPEVIQSQPAESTGSGEPSSIAGHDATPSPDRESSIPSEPTSESLEQAKPAGGETPAMTTAQKASPPEEKSAHPKKQKPNGVTKKENRKAHSIAISQSSRVAEKSTEAPGSVHSLRSEILKVEPRTPLKPPVNPPGSGSKPDPSPSSGFPGQSFPVPRTPAGNSSGGGC